ncbi:hypothetical protein ANCDUO_03599 [Ancylostoma duodenale]|uniref:Uncharacterized protein n=1 Tax=Ancylostoma duodenale TaxID=51022 RepID=A0A0C2H961_9BILA|nr:hypothetical protein ANCDUO_03599 [Ancylostoma duodenale]
MIWLKKRSTCEANNARDAPNEIHALWITAIMEANVYETAQNSSANALKATTESTASWTPTNATCHRAHSGNA